MFCRWISWAGSIPCMCRSIIWTLRSWSWRPSNLLGNGCVDAVVPYNYCKLLFFEAVPHQDWNWGFMFFFDSYQKFSCLLLVQGKSYCSNFIRRCVVIVLILHRAMHKLHNSWGRMEMRLLHGWISITTRYQWVKFSIRWCQLVDW